MSQDTTKRSQLTLKFSYARLQYINAALIPSLLRPAGPLQISRLVVAVIVNPVQGVSFWSLPKIFVNPPKESWGILYPFAMN